MSPYTTPTLPIVSAQNVVRPFAFAGVAPRRAAATVVMGDVIFAANAAPQYNTAARVYNRAVGARWRLHPLLQNPGIFSVACGPRRPHPLEHQPAGPPPPPRLA